LVGYESFREELMATKLTLAPAAEWYPYESLNNVWALDALLSPENRDLGKLAGGRPVADIGAGDGDIAFLLARHGFAVDIVDYGPTNWNQLRGARMLAKHFHTGVRVYETDLDDQFTLPRTSYGLILFLGILYHLQNPIYALRHLSAVSDHLLLSTRVAQVTADGAVRLADAPVAYLVDPTETNNDPTNWWIFSPPGLTRLLDRTGWDVLDSYTHGRTGGDSDPSADDRDERTFLLLRSRQRMG
jgi:tRNA (mo5U34)-methyltransferase